MEAYFKGMEIEGEYNEKRPTLSRAFSGLNNL
jgi:hypothetical protein